MQPLMHARACCAFRRVRARASALCGSQENNAALLNREVIPCYSYGVRLTPNQLERCCPHQSQRREGTQARPHPPPKKRHPPSSQASLCVPQARSQGSPSPGCRSPMAPGPLSPPASGPARGQASLLIDPCRKVNVNAAQRVRFASCRQLPCLNWGPCHDFARPLMRGMCDELKQ